MAQQISTEGASKDSDISCLLIGKIGLGKSTTGNKLIGFYDSEPEISRYKYCHYGLNCSEVRTVEKRSDTQHIKFEEGGSDSIDATTKQSKLLENTYLDVKVLDVCGLASTSRSIYSTVYEQNLSTFRDILRMQERHNLKFNRVLYFLPNRRFPEKADAILQDELRVMHYFFGEDVFECMIIVLTSSPLTLQEDNLVITAKMNKHTEEVFRAAVLTSTGISLRFCPPIIYIAKNYSGVKIRGMIKSATVGRVSGLSLKIKEDICINCATTITSTVTKNEKHRVTINEIDGEEKEYEKTKCHPGFKYPIYELNYFRRTSCPCINCLLFVLNFLYTWLFKKSLRIGLSEVCINCGKSPGTPGCYLVENEFMNHEGQWTVEHTNSLESLRPMHYS